MKTILNRSRSKMIGLGLLLAVLTLLGSAVIVQGATKPADAPTLVKQRDFGSWSYVLKQDANNALSAEVHFDSATVKGIQAFVADNKVLANQLAAVRPAGPQAEVLVVFKAPMDINAYRAWATKAGITYFKATHVMAIDGRSTDAAHPLPPIQMSVFQASSDPLPKANLEQAIKSTESASGGDITVRGVDAFQAKVDASRLLAIANDPQVLIADVTANVVRNDLSKAGIKNPDQVEVYNPIPIFNVEDLSSTPNSH